MSVHFRKKIITFKLHEPEKISSIKPTFENQIMSFRCQFALRFENVQMTTVNYSTCIAYKWILFPPGCWQGLWKLSWPRRMFGWEHALSARSDYSSADVHWLVGNGIAHPCRNRSPGFDNDPDALQDYHCVIM